MIDHIVFRVIVHATEEESKVYSALDFFLFYCNNSKNPLQITNVDGYYGNQIIIAESKIFKKSECTKFIELCNKKMSSEDKSILHLEINKRLDENLNLYLRFDKQEAYSKKLKLTNKEDAIFIKIKIKTYPKSIEKARSILEGLFV